MDKEQAMIEWLKESLELGYSEDTLIKQIRAHGYQANLIRKAKELLEKDQLVQKTAEFAKTYEKEKKHKGFSEILGLGFSALAVAIAFTYVVNLLTDLPGLGMLAGISDMFNLIALAAWIAFFAITAYLLIFKLKLLNRLHHIFKKKT